jgi:hypothetical protein
MNDLANIPNKVEMTDSNHLEKMLKLVQYSTRLANIRLKRVPLQNFVRHLSMVRRLLRTLRQLSIIQSLLTFSQHNKILSRRFLRYIFFIGLLIFFSLDFVILLSQMKLIKNRKFIQGVFDFIDFHWLFQNFIGIIDNLIQISGLDRQKDKEKVDFLCNDIFKLVLDSGLALGFEYSILGEEFVSISGLMSGIVGLNNLPAQK